MNTSTPATRPWSCGHDRSHDPAPRPDAMTQLSNTQDPSCGCSIAPAERSVIGMSNGNALEGRIEGLSSREHTKWMRSETHQPSPRLRTAAS